MKNWIALLRVRHWVKNLFIFTPILFGGQLLDLVKLQASGLAFICFCLGASSIYIINDIKDIEFDRVHPYKSKRPIVSGAIPIRWAWILSFVLVVLCLTISFTISPSLGYIMSMYIALNVSYSFGLKHIAIVDIVIIAIGFILRVFAGGVVTGIEISHWLIIMTFLLALFLGIAKRREDINLEADQQGRTRKSIDGYSIEFINQAMVLMAAVILMCYMMYVTSLEVLERFSGKYAYLSAIFVIVGVLRYLQLAVVKEATGSPLRTLLEDRFTQITLVLWLLYFFLVIYIL